MVHDSCHVWNGWGHTDLIKFPYMSTPHSLSAHVFLIHTGCVCHWPHCATFTGVTGLEGYPIFKLSRKSELLCPVSYSSSLELVTEHVSTIACPVQCRVGCTEEELVLGKILCGFGLWHLRWASSIRVVIGGDVSKTRKGQALMSVSVSKHKGRNQALGP